MTVRTVKLAGKEFVILAKGDYRRLQARAQAKVKSARKPRRLSAQDRADLAEARRRLNDPAEKPIPYAQARREMGLT